MIRIERLRGRLPLFRHRPGSHRDHPGALPGRAENGRSPAGRQGQLSEPARLHAERVVRTPVFWVMYSMFVIVGAGGLMATAQLGPIANDFKIAEVPVRLLGITLPALTFAATIDRVLNGLTRPFFGWVSDKIGRENTMFIAFSIEGVGICALSACWATIRFCSCS